MPATDFICPGGNRVNICDCLQSCPNAAQMPAGRCLPTRTLRLIAEQRPWEGKPSTTQLLKGTREAYLEITCDYPMDPQGELFRILGTRAHAALDTATGDNELGEIRLHDDMASGKFDFYDKETHYRILLEAAGHPVQQMFVEAIVRDGGTYMAKGRGIERNGYLIPVKRLPDEEVQEYIQAKASALLQALETGTIPPACTTEETWEGRKCADYCRVAEFCDVGRAAKQAPAEDGNGTDG